MTFLSTGLPKIAGTNTMRLAMSPLFVRKKEISKGFDFEMGRNWQNIEKSKRAIVVTPDGYSIIQADQSGADARIVAYEAPPGNFRDLFLNKIKPHCYVALRRFTNEFSTRCPERANEFQQASNTPIRELRNLSFWPQLDDIIRSSDGWAARDRYYFIGKTQCHQLNYLCGPKQYKDTLIERSQGTLILSKKESIYDVETYRKIFAEIFEVWHLRVFAEHKKTGILRNLFGHPRKFTQFLDDVSKKNLLAFIPQSTVGVITHIAAIKFQKYREQKRLRWYLFNNCHDSLAAIAPDDEALECAAKMKEFMECDLRSTRGDDYRMGAGVAIGKNWAPYEAKKNPFGMKEL